MRLYQSGNISFIFDRSIKWGYINQETFPSSLTIQSYEVISIRKHFLHLWPFNHMRLHQSGNVSFIFDRSIIWGYINQETFPSSLTFQSYEVISIRKHIFDRSIIWGYINQETFPSSLTFQSYEVISIRKHFLHLWPFNHMRLYQSGNISFIFDRSIIWGYINQETLPSSLTIQSYEVISIRKHFLHLWPFNHMRLYQSGNITFIFDRSIIWGYINQETFPSSLTVQSYEVISIRKRFLHLWPFNHMRLYQSGNVSFIFDHSIIWGYINQETFPSSLTVQSYEVISIRKRFLHLYPFNHMRLYQSGNVSFIFDRSIIWGYINQETFPSSLTVQSYEVISIRKHFLHLWPFNHMRLYQSGNITFIFDRSIIWGYINQETLPSSLTVQSYEVISIRKRFLHLWPFNNMRLYQSGNISFIFDRSIIWGYINQETFPSSLTVQSYEVISIRKRFLHL